MSTKNSYRQLGSWSINPDIKWWHWLGMIIIVVASISIYIVRVRQNCEIDSLADDWRNYISVGETVHWGSPYRRGNRRKKALRYKVISVNEKSVIIKIEAPKNEMYPALKNEE